MNTLRFPNGAEATGQLIEIPLQPHEFIEDPDHAVALLEQAVDLAVEWGAELVGLGSLTGIVGGRGTHLADRGRCAITTGNSLTSYAALQNIYRVCDEFELELSRQTVAVIGVPGSIASCAAVLLAPHVGRLLLVGRRASSPSKRLAKELGAEFFTSVDAVTSDAGILLTATSSGGCIDPRMLASGSIVVDVGVPTDVIDEGRERDDVLILTGGLARLPNSVPRESTFLWFHNGVIPSCLAETMVLALENRVENFSLGRELCPDRVQEIGGIAVRHGFDFSVLQSNGYSITGSRLTAFRKTLTRMGITTGLGHRDVPTCEERSRNRVERHLNPVLASLAGTNGIIQTFVRGSGTTLVGEDGTEFLDLVGGFGSLNLGHNHPRIVAAIQRTLANEPAGFTPSAIHPLAAELAERLIALAPPNLELVTFANSGTEAVEAAIKLARAATRRSGLLSCHGSFHGKTLGSLSLTGHRDYQQPFEPLVPQCEKVVFGDIEQLERQLRTRRFAAFVVEPIQAEGGVHLPPDGYLQRARAVCRETETLFILDEVQTGFGRTGKLFAAELLDVTPDVMTLAKSLGGGLVPIGAMLCRRDLWLAAYGSIDRFALHTSTFAGGPLACAAGLETLATLADEQLAERAERLGEIFLDGLSVLCGKHKCLKDARGSGLLIGLEFHPLPTRTLQHWHEISQDPVSRYLAPGVDQALRTMPVLYVLRALLDQHHIYAQATRSQPLVLRIEPPLTISESEIERVLSAIDQISADFDIAAAVTDEVIGRSSVGRHEAGQRST
ncbi:MAG: aminotransferase class III-fold pyridoxal phosphate-dependent enzyme [Planctomycetota bacterium]|nr:aminotransferase class III-fold pyridoxal phosphate-dependent enzyme [Planctomycetota bacterium]